MKGSSILEALLATAVITVGVLAIGVLTGALIRGNRGSGDVASASFAAEEQIERLLADAPLNLGTDLSLGPHPADVGGSWRYQGLDRSGQMVAAAVAAGAPGYQLLRRWEVADASTTRCLRRVRVAVRNSEGARELASAESYVNCP